MTYLMKHQLLIFLTSLLTTGIMTVSCREDETSAGMEGTTFVSNISISGMAERYICTSYVGEVLSIEPSVTSGYDENELHYRWSLLNAQTGNVEDGDTILPVIISEARNLYYEVAIAPGVYQLRLEVSADNGYRVYSTASLNVVTDFSQGFYILKEMPDRTTELDLITIHDDLMENIIQATQGSSISGTPLQMNISYNCFYINPDNDRMEGTNKLNITTQEGGIYIYRTNDMLRIFDRSNLKYDLMETDEHPYTIIRNAADNEILFTSQGVYTVRGKGDFSEAAGSANSGRFGYPETECGTSKFLYHDVNSFGCIVFWDEKNRSVMCTNYNVMTDVLTDNSLGGKEETEQQENFTCLDAGICNSSGTGHLILSDTKNGTRYMYTTKSENMQVYYTGRKQIASSAHIHRSRLFATCGIQGNYVYCIDNNKLYGCNLNSASLAEIEMPLSGIPSGETINFITNQWWDSSFVSENNFDYLIIGTQQGSKYTLYFYKMTGGVPDGEPVRIYQGTGTVRAVRFLSQNFDPNDYYFSYPVCPNY